MGDIIYAKASGAGPAAIAVIRLSGAGCHALIAQMLSSPPPPIRVASLRKLLNLHDREPIDQALLLLFAEGASYTGEESAELHLHGGEAVSAAVFDVLEQLGARLARPGEFSRRALQNGALDLSKAESIAALIAAETQIERQQAMRGLDGEIGELATRWRETLISLIGLLETGVDFVEEALGDELIEEAQLRLEVFRTELSVHIEEASRIELRRDRPQVALIGPPNAGKSSLLNAIAGVERAIVSSQAGTTRDVVELSLRIAGQELVLSDTAGIRESVDAIEAQGVERSRKAMQSSDRRIFVVSADTWEEFSPLLQEIKAKDAVFWTKIDVSEPSASQKQALAGRRLYLTSSANAIEARRLFEQYLTATMPGQTAPLSPIIGSERRIALLRSADSHLESAAARLQESASELSIEELRRAAERLAALTGAIDQEDVLDALFSRFCIGK